MAQHTSTKPHTLLTQNTSYLLSEKSRMRAKMFLATILVLGLIVPGTCATSASPAFAASGQASVTTGDDIVYGGYCTRYAESNGVPIFCAQPDKESITGGTYSYTTDWNCIDESAAQFGPIDSKYLVAAIYFGYGGPGFTKSMWPSTWFNGETMTDEYYYVLTHLMVSYMYTHSLGTALEGTEDDFKAWLVEHVICNYSTGQGVDNPSNTRVQIYAQADSVPAAFASSVFMIAGTDIRQSYFGYLPSGYLDLQKASNNTAISNGNSCYSVKGATYGIYTDKACTTLVTYADTGKQAKVTTDVDGYAKSNALTPGTYYVKEIAASPGYALDNAVYTATVNGNSTTRINKATVYEVPQNNPLGILVGKHDSAFEYNETTNLPQGGASLEGAEFSVVYYDGFYTTIEAAQASGSATHSWVFATDEQGRIELAENYLLSGDKLYASSDGTPCLPLGTYLIQETKAPIGYLLNDAIFVRQVTASGTTEAVQTYHAPAVPNTIKRGDIEFTKRDGNTAAPMANVAFSIESTTTHERHVVVTDENGYFSSSTVYNSHTANTNANDAAVTWQDNGTYSVDSSLLDAYAGVWFGMNTDGQTAATDDSLGAFPYDTYEIVELSCDANTDRQLATKQIITVSRDTFTIDLGTIDDALGDVSTKLTNAHDGTSLVAPEEKCALIDTLSYSNLIIDRTYDALTTLYDLTDDNKLLTCSETSFTAEKATGTLKVDIVYDTSDLAGHELAVQQMISYQDHTVAVHNTNLADTDQKILVESPDTPVVEETKPAGEDHVLPNKAKPTTTSSSPKTGDDLLPFVIGCTAVVCASAICAFYALRRHRKAAQAQRSPWISATHDRRP